MVGYIRNIGVKRGRIAQVLSRKYLVGVAHIQDKPFRYIRAQRHQDCCWVVGTLPRPIPALGRVFREDCTIGHGIFGRLFADGD